MKATVYAMHVDKRSLVVIDSIVAGQRDWLMNTEEEEWELSEYAGKGDSAEDAEYLAVYRGVSYLETTWRDS